MTKVHIIIPIYNHWNLCHARLWELYKHESENIAKVYIANDCSTDEEVETGLEWWMDRHVFDIEVINTKKNVGFLQNSNNALHAVCISKTHPDDIVILLSSDVEIRGKFIQQIIDSVSNQTLVGGVLYTHDTGWNMFDGEVYPYLEGWLLATLSGGWVELGLFDPRYSPCDFEDVDISTTAKKLGYNLVALNNPNLHHLGAQSIGYNPQREAQTKINREKFRDKWIK